MQFHNRNLFWYIGSVQWENNRKMGTALLSFPNPAGCALKFHMQESAQMKGKVLKSQTRTINLVKYSNKEDA